MNRKEVEDALTKCLDAEHSPKRKFVQSIDLAINFRDIDFGKPENRLNLKIILPHTVRGEKIAVFATGALFVEAQKKADWAISEEELNTMAGDKAKEKRLLEHKLLAEPKLMMAVAKVFGKVLGPKGKLPSPIPPNANLEKMIESEKRMTSIKTKGKNLPSVHCLVGKENMEKKDIIDNTMAILDAVKDKVSLSQVKSFALKTTMGKAVKVWVK